MPITFLIKIVIQLFSTAHVIIAFNVRWKKENVIRPVFLILHILKRGNRGHRDNHYIISPLSPFVFKYYHNSLRSIARLYLCSGHIV